MATPTGKLGMFGAARAVVVAACAGVFAGGCGIMDDIQPGAPGLLAIFQGPSPGEAADLALDEFNADNRYRGTVLLANAPFGGEPVYIELYQDAAADPDPGVRAAGIRALGIHGEPEHVPLIVRALRDEDRLVRMDAARALQRLHNPVAVDALLRSIRQDVEREPQVRAAAAHALGQYPENRVVQALIAALNDPNLVVNRNTLHALRTLTGQDFGLDVRAWLDWIDRTPDVFAARAPYTYPAFQRDHRLHEYLPFIPPPPNEVPSAPVGMPPPGR